MTLQDLGSLGEVVGALAVIASLAYLAVQIRQNTTSVRAATSASVAESLSRWSEVVGSDPRSAQIWVEGLGDPTELDGAAAMQFMFLFNTYLRRVENAYYQQRRGLLDSDHWQTTEQIFRRTMENPGAQHSWRVSRAGYSDRFVEFVEGTTSQGAA